MSTHGFYSRLMDDWVIMVKTTHQLRRMIKLTHRLLTKFKLKMHQEKIFIGCIKKGFDFLDIYFVLKKAVLGQLFATHRLY